MFHMKFGFDWPSGFREDYLNIVNDDNDVGIMEAQLVSLHGSGELKCYA